MLRIVTRDGKKHQWQIGDDPKPDISPVDIVAIHANGDENYFILRNFDGIPKNPSATTQWWFGEMAQFIFANLEGYWQAHGEPQRAVLKKGVT